MKVFKENGEYTHEYVEQLRRTVSDLKKDVAIMHEQLIKASYSVADAMMKERSK